MKPKINLSGLHLLITYQCTFECDHCFVWGSPWQNGTMTAENVINIIDQAKEVNTIDSIYFEGGEPFLYYPILLTGVDYAHKNGFKVGIVTNGYWANDPNDAVLWLEPLNGKIDDLSISTDLFHFSKMTSEQSVNIQQACSKLNIPSETISISQPDQEEINFGGLMYKGRASEKLAKGREKIKSIDLNHCPYENLTDPSRFHVDPMGYVHICQGIVAGNVYKTPLSKILKNYNPIEHSIVKSLIEGGPNKLARDYHIPSRRYYADACHMCYEIRESIRTKSIDFLQPDQVYGRF